MVWPACCSISLSRSQNRHPRLPASFSPTVLLPAPMNPMRKTLATRMRTNPALGRILTSVEQSETIGRTTGITGVGRPEGFLVLRNGYLAAWILCPRDRRRREWLHRPAFILFFLPIPRRWQIALGRCLLFAASPECCPRLWDWDRA